LLLAVRPFSLRLAGGAYLEAFMETESAMKVTMEAVGTITNPDGTTKEIILKAERPLTQEEFRDGNYTVECSFDGCS